MASPQIQQGTLNRGLVSVAVINFPNLNVTSGYFGNKLARISFEGETSDYIPTLTGAVPSPRLFQAASITFYINKSQGLSAAWEQQRLTNSIIGDVSVVTDSKPLGSYYFTNCVLMNIAELDLTGESNDFPVMLRGTYQINGSLFS